MFLYVHVFGMLTPVIFVRVVGGPVLRLGTFWRHGNGNISNNLDIVVQTKIQTIRNHLILLLLCT